MGLFDKIFSKVVVPDRMIFKDFAKFFEMNNERARLDFKSCSKDMKKIVMSKHIYAQVGDIYEERQKIKADFFDISQGKEFSSNIGAVVHFSKMYAMNYMYTDEGKTDAEVLHAYNQLDKLYDVAVFATLSYFNYARHEKLTFDNGRFELFANVNDVSKHILNVIVEVLTDIVRLARAIKEKDNTKYQNYFCQTWVYKNSYLE